MTRLFRATFTRFAFTRFAFTRFAFSGIVLTGLGLAGLGTIAPVGAALAHSGVTNPAVMARMDAMSGIAKEVKALSGMARGEVTFDATEVATRMAAIVTAGTQVPALFEAPEMDPKSEASPTIWASYPEFTQRAQAMVEAAKAGGDVADGFDLAEALASLGQTCKSCHASYKIQP